MFVCSTVLAITYNPYGSSGLNTSYSGNYDDGSVAVSLPWSVSFLGTSYSTAYVGTNGYVTFGSGNSTYYNFSASNPSQPHIAVYPGDRRLYTLYTGEVNGGTSSAYFVIRVEGVDYSNAAITHVYEIHFYANQSYFDVIFVDAPSSGNQNGGTSGVSNGTTYESTFTVTEGTAIRLNLSDGSEVATTSTTTGTSPGPTSTQATIKSSAQTRRDSYSGDDNGIYIDQAGNNNSITILQDSDNNQIRGIDQQRAKMWGNYNVYDIRQGASTTTGINLIELMVDGNSNDLELFQDRFNDGTADSSASGDNILRIDIDGNSNTVATNQRGETNAGGQFGEIIITGDSNTVDLMQRSTLGETAFIDITGDSNVVDLLQQNTSNAVGSSKFADIKLTGDGHTVNLTQDGTGGHQATIDLTFGSASSTVNLDQLGSTSQSFSIEQTCYTVGGCSTTLTQQ
jgi:hypothetical protein